MTIASEKEIWKPIKNLEGLYEVSSEGNIRSVDRYVNHFRGGMALRKGKNLNLHKSKKTGYVQCSLYYKNKEHSYLVHRLVAEAFPEICGETFPGYEIDHINTIRDDNRAINLRVCTRQENHMNPITRERYKVSSPRNLLGHKVWNKGSKMPQMTGEKHPRAKAILMFDHDMNLLKEFKCIADAARELGILYTAICNNLSNRSETCNGFIFKYKEVEIVY